MSHDLYSTWATAEIVRNIIDNPQLLFRSGIDTTSLTAFANREGGRSWPIPDGRITTHLANRNFDTAIELKRTNEGLHGVLTAIGQSHAYLHKGYNSSIIVIPETYISHSYPAEYIRQVIDQTTNNLPIGVFSYKLPDTSKTLPFYDKITCHRPINFDVDNVVVTEAKLAAATNTQWAHLREGSSEAHAFFKYLQTAKRVSTSSLMIPPDISHLPQGLIDAVISITGNAPLDYLCYAPGNNLHDLIWKYFWVENILTTQVCSIWDSNIPYSVFDANSGLILDDGKFKKFFSGRTDSIKNRLVDELNNREISEPQAWKRFAENIHKRAHSYREDIDSGLSHLGFLEDDGRPTELGYRFVDVCERTGDCYKGQAKMILGAAILKNGDIASLLHYFYKISEEIFNENNFAFTSVNKSRYTFKTEEYLNKVRDILAYNLKVMNTATIRGGKARKLFQGEFAVLNKFGFIGSGTNRYRIGNGLLINWPLIQEYMDYEI